MLQITSIYSTKGAETRGGMPLERFKSHLRIPSSGHSTKGKSRILECWDRIFVNHFFSNRIGSWIRCPATMRIGAMPLAGIILSVKFSAIHSAPRRGRDPISTQTNLSNILASSRRLLVGERESVRQSRLPGFNECDFHWPTRFESKKLCRQEASLNPYQRKLSRKWGKPIK